MKKNVREKEFTLGWLNHFTLSKLKCFVLTVIAFYFFCDASNLMQNKIPHSKLLSPTMLGIPL